MHLKYLALNRLSTFLSFALDFSISQRALRMGLSQLIWLQLTGKDSLLQSKWHEGCYI
jgi:hypothetical protein